MMWSIFNSGWKINGNKDFVKRGHHFAYLWITHSIRKKLNAEFKKISIFFLYAAGLVYENPQSLFGVCDIGRVILQIVGIAVDSIVEQFEKKIFFWLEVIVYPSLADFSPGCYCVKSGAVIAFFIDKTVIIWYTLSLRWIKNIVTQHLDK